MNPSSPAPALAALAATLAPGGTLRASINLGNPMLAARDPATAAVVGVSVDLARALAQRLGVPVELVAFDKAAQSVEAVRTERADIGFFAIDPARSEGISFATPYVNISGAYAVPQDSPIRGLASCSTTFSPIG